MIRQLVEQFCQLLPIDCVSNTEIKKNSEALLLGFFSKLQLVTREEFEIQSQVLARAEETIRALEIKITELEAQLLNQTSIHRGESS